MNVKMITKKYKKMYGIFCIIKLNTITFLSIKLSKGVYNMRSFKFISLIVYGFIHIVQCYNYLNLIMNLYNKYSFKLILL